MVVEMTPDEAKLLIAILTGAEGAFMVTNLALVEALKQLRPWRTALLQAYLTERLTADNGRAHGTKSSL